MRKVTVTVCVGLFFVLQLAAFEIAKKQSTMDKYGNPCGPIK